MNVPHLRKGGSKDFKSLDQAACRTNEGRMEGKSSDADYFIEL